MDLNLLIHTIASVLALLAGGLIFIIPKGTVRHRKLGYAYAINMGILLVTSFFIFDLWGAFGVYHALSIVSFVTLAIALYYPIKGRNSKHWMRQHMIWMGYSYIGLVMAGGSHLFSVFPDWSPWLRAGLFWGLPYIVGSVLIFSNAKKTVDRARKNIKSRE